MIVLLPLRGWMGDAMATQMAVSGGKVHAVAEQAAIGTHDHGHAHADDRQQAPLALTGDCGDHLPDAHGMAQDLHCQTCTICQACHGVAITVPPTDAQGDTPAAGVPPAVTQDFASADRALGLKPPIS